MRVVHSGSISKPAEEQALAVLVVVGLLHNLSCGVLLKGRLDAAIRAITRGWPLLSN